MLSSKLRSKFNVTSQYIIISQSDRKCFGEPAFQFLALTFRLPPTIILNSIFSLIHRENLQQQHFIRHHLSNTIIRLPYSCGYPTFFERFVFKIISLLSSVVLFFVATALINFTFHESQNRMLSFTLKLQSYIRSREGITNLIINHISDMLLISLPTSIGLLFFLLPFLHYDRLLTFGLFNLLWVGEVFAVFQQSSPSRFYFPRAFFLYFTFFCTYVMGSTVVNMNCAMSSGDGPQAGLVKSNSLSYLCLITTWLFLIHNMLFFWNRYELPLLSEEHNNTIQISRENSVSWKIQTIL